MADLDKEMEGYARDCVRLAGLAQDHELREQLLQMARHWMAAAMHEERATGVDSKANKVSFRLRAESRNAADPRCAEGRSPD
jgi:hypothetical protein